MGLETAALPCPSKIREKPENFLSNTFNNISVIKVLTNLKIRYPSGDGLLLATLETTSFVCQYLKRSAPNNQTVSKWRCFGHFRRFWPSQSRQVPKK